MKKVRPLILLIILILIQTDLAAQNFEEWRDQQQRLFQDFKKEQDEAFLKMLREAWETMEVESPEPILDEPKPDQLPELDPLENSDFFQQGIPFEFRPRSMPEPQQPELVQPPLDHRPEPAVRELPFGVRETSFDFFTVDVPYIYLPEMVIRLNGLPSQESVMNYWSEMAQSDYQWHLERILDLRSSLGLNDWATIKAVHRMGKDLYGQSVNEVRLFSWFILTKLGYDVKVAFNHTTLFTLYHFDRNLYNTQFLTLDGKRYYTLQLGEDSGRQRLLTSYNGSYEGADQPITLRVDQLPDLPAQKESRSLSFYWKDQSYSISVSYNTNVIDYLRHFPSTELDVYVHAGISRTTRTDLVEQLGALIEDRSELEAVSMLLRFVQTAFEYKTDGEQFGIQKYMTPEEIFYYPYSDCDDRTVLMAFLIRELLGLDVIALRYPNHLALAVNLQGDPVGDTVYFGGAVYTVADPTYINALPGMTMPQFRSITPEIIEI